MKDFQSAGGAFISLEKVQFKKIWFFNIKNSIFTGGKGGGGYPQQSLKKHEKIRKNTWYLILPGKASVTSAYWGQGSD
jgi:hypothetical protein